MSGVVLRTGRERTGLEGALESGSPELYRRLIESVPDYAIFALDIEGHIISWNPGAQRLKGYSESEILGRHFSVFYPESDIAAGKPEWELDVAARDGRLEDEGWRLRKDGSRFWANVVISAVRDDHGVAVGFAKVTRDLTERRAAEEALRQSEERFRLLVQSVRDYAILLLDPDGRVVSWNEGAERLKGYTADEIIGRPFSTFYPEDIAASGFPEEQLEIAAREGRIENEGWRVRRDGTRFWANAIITALRDDEGRLVGFAKVTRDLTARREAEEQALKLAAEEAAHAATLEHSRELAELNERLQTQKEELERARAAAERAARARDEVLAIVAHDLRNPLHTINAAATMIELTNEQEKRERQVGIIERSTRKMERLIADLLDVSRIEAGTFGLEPAQVEPSGLFDEALELFAPRALEHGVALACHVEPDIGPVEADHDRLLQVLGNLLDNALKFTPEGGEVAVRATLEGAVRISVHDSGTGIPEEALAHVFDRFWQASRSARAGAGLGLAICKGIVEAHGGRIWAESAPGRGTTMHFTLPRPG
ncbi:MAG: PAS domain S-box protein [Longimicrobiales bacterium]